ncbi:hypothetical protein SCHPADRAFT_936597 [Schizopora paradoxa]|uniref:F-box domain-containing protein n=1 Tax=Schizopora paradoxa TaxID=27342 RepID=A0A0H2S8I4_9AGAM|nr:hypothetical protein SCHPADRAFT_936597 [Schizopora paradoxa]
MHFDILTEIFSICLDSTSINIRDAQSSLILRDLPPRPFARVCRHWRSAVLSSPKLWAHWSISLRIQSMNNAENTEANVIFDAAQRFIEERLLRSGTATLDFEFKLEVGGPDNSGRLLARLDALVSLLVAQQARWAHASLSILNNGAWGDGAFGKRWALVPARMQNLKALTLSGHRYLKSLRPRTVASNSASSRTLDLLRVDFASIRSCKVWLSRFPLLRSFRAHVMHSGGDVDVGHMVLPALRTVHLTCHASVSGGNGSAPMLALLLNSMTCGALERLTVHGQLSNGASVGALNSFLERSAPSALSTLILQGVSAGDVLPCLEHLIGLSSLHIRCTDTADSGIVNVLAGRRVCPLLEHLSLMDIEAPDEDFTRLITSRWNTVPRMLKTVRLTRCFATFDWQHPQRLRDGLPPSWFNVNLCMEEGLVLECLSIFDYELM